MQTPGSQSFTFLCVLLLAACAGSNNSTPQADTTSPNDTASQIEALGPAPQIAPMVDLCSEPVPEKML
ncbi:MAG TPA: hypothetical protein EYN66_18765 [Myxococcales bacterium]|nr:hypothetical protein [Myxococcales bacterium]